MMLSVCDGGDVDDVVVVVEVGGRGWWVEDGL